MTTLDPKNLDFDLSQVGVVIIGRNEGQRLKNCFLSLIKKTSKIVYVDSGSTDASLQLAESLAIDTVSLDLSIPFTAARARNAGYQKLLSLYANLNYVQFVDGDCEVDDLWLENAFSFLNNQPEYAIVCGRRREMFPDNSIYNKLCDLEWAGQTGDVKACGGDALMRVKAFNEVSGFREDLIAGEEPELCVRLRFKGWKIYRLDHEMTRHDADMLYFKQWWRRSTRAGYAFANGFYLHGNSTEKHYKTENMRILAWGLALPLLTLLTSVIFNVWFLLLLLIYPLRIIRLATKKGIGDFESWLSGLFLVICQFPEFLGLIKFIWVKLKGNHYKLIEYK